MAKVFAIVRYTETLKDNRNPKMGFQHNEAFILSKNIKTKDYQEAAVILDIANEKVVKNRFNDRPFNEVWTYYIQHYGDYINQWFRNQSK
jgi:hypothetical protein